MNAFPDWWTGIYTDDGEQLPHDAPTDYEPNRGQDWWRVSRTVLPPLAPLPHEYDQQEDDEARPAAPTVHVTVTAPAAPAWRLPTRHDLRRRARLRWLAYYGGAGAAGWAFGLVDTAGSAMSSGGGVGMGVGFVIIGGLFASYMAHLPFIPPQYRHIVLWLACIPASSAALALALYTPGSTL